MIKNIEDTLKLALEALKQMQAKANFECWNLEICDEAIKALEEALAKQEGQSNFCPQCEALARELKAVKQEQRSDSEHLGEPVAWITPAGEGFRIRFSPPVNDVPLGWDALYTTPYVPEGRQQRTWVGLTHEEIDYQAKKDDHAVYFALGALWAEAKLKEKNT
jgi:hypothetical protein